MTELSLWAHLDPARALREIEDADDNTFNFDQYSLLDPAHAAAQVAAVLGVEITPFDRQLDRSLQQRGRAKLRGRPGVAVQRRRHRHPGGRR
jgi:hypothetical protein